MSEKIVADGGADGSPACGRAEELVTYLYGEATPEEAQAFSAHLGACPACREDLAAFGGVRSRVALWREEAQGLAPSPGALWSADPGPEGLTAEPLQPGHEPARTPRARSAAAAFREFFSLSPVWLRAFGPAGALAVCVLAALTLARGEIRWGADGLVFSTGASAHGPETNDVARPPLPTATRVTYTREEVDAIVAERVRTEVAALRELLESRDERAQAADAGASAKSQAPRLVETSGRSSAARRRPSTKGLAPSPAIAGGDEASLPRLSDLLGGSYD